MADESLEKRVPQPPRPGKRRVKSRAAVGEKDNPSVPPPDDAAVQAEALLEESDARVEDPAARSLDDPRVDRRTSDEATPPDGV